MFDEDELKELQEGRDSWEGVKERAGSAKGSFVSRKRLFSSLGVSVVLVVVLISMLVSMNMVAAIAVGEVGGFRAKFPKVTGNDVTIYPAVGESSACDKQLGADNPSYPDDGEQGLPMLKADITQADVTYQLPDGSYAPIQFIKDIRTPDIVAANSIDVFRIKISQWGDLSTLQKTELGDAALYLTDLEASNLTLKGGATIFENYSNDEDSDNTPPNPIFGPAGRYNGFPVKSEFVVTGQTAVIKNGTARAHFLAFDKLVIPHLDISLKYNPPKPWYNKTDSTCDVTT